MNHWNYYQYAFFIHLKQEFLSECMTIYWRTQISFPPFCLNLRIFEKLSILSSMHIQSNLKRIIDWNVSRKSAWSRFELFSKKRKYICSQSVRTSLLFSKAWHVTGHCFRQAKPSSCITHIPANESIFNDQMVEARPGKEWGANPGKDGSSQATASSSLPSPSLPSPSPSPAPSCTPRPGLQIQIPALLASLGLASFHIGRGRPCISYPHEQEHPAVELGSICSWSPPSPCCASPSPPSCSDQTGVGNSTSLRSRIPSGKFGSLSSENGGQSFVDWTGLCIRGTPRTSQSGWCRLREGQDLGTGRSIRVALWTRKETWGDKLKLLVDSYQEDGSTAVQRLTWWSAHTERNCQNYSLISNYPSCYPSKRLQMIIVVRIILLVSNDSNQARPHWE